MSRRDDDLDKELRFHLDQHIADLIARGHDPAEARRLARLDFGGPEQVKEACRDVRPSRWLEDLSLDVRHALRSLAAKPGFAAVALLTLALGTGATTVMFSVINGVMLKPFAYREPQRLVRLYQQTDWSTPQGNIWTFTYPNYLDCRKKSTSLDMVAFAVDRARWPSRGRLNTPWRFRHRTIFFRFWA